MDVIKTLREQARTQRAELKKTERALAALEPAAKNGKARRPGRPKGSKTVRRGLSDDVQAGMKSRREGKKAAAESSADLTAL
jgi:hypothetical protein